MSSVERWSWMEWWPVFKKPTECHERQCLDDVVTLQLSIFCRAAFEGILKNASNTITIDTSYIQHPLFVVHYVEMYNSAYGAYDCWTISIWTVLIKSHGESYWLVMATLKNHYDLLAIMAVEWIRKINPANQSHHIENRTGNCVSLNTILTGVK